MDSTTSQGEKEWSFGRLFAYRLAKELGVWDVNGMLEAMTWREFANWMRYAAREPFGEEQADIRSAILASIIANANRDPKKHPRPFTPKDFMLNRRRRASNYKPMTDPQAFKSMSRTLAEAMGHRQQRPAEAA